MAQLSPEAIRQSREILHHGPPEGSLLQNSLAEIATEDYHNLPAPDTKEAQEFMDKIKPERFAALAKAIDMLFTNTFSMQKNRDQYGLLSSTSIKDDGWSHVSSKFLNTLHKDIDSLKSDPCFEYVDDINFLTSRVTGGRILMASDQLFAGVNTAVDTNLSLLKKIPVLVQEFDPNLPYEDWTHVAQASAGLSYSLSRRSIESLMAARDKVLQLDSPGVEDLSKYKPIYHGNKLVAIGFKELEEQMVPAGYWTPPYAETMAGEVLSQVLLKDLYSRSKVIIGCPVTLLNQRLRELWNWNIEVIFNEHLWRIDGD